MLPKECDKDIQLVKKNEILSQTFFSREFVGQARAGAPYGTGGRPLVMIYFNTLGRRPAGAPARLLVYYLTI